MNKVFKAFFLKQLRLELEQGRLVLSPDFPASVALYKIWKNVLYKKEWVVYAKKPFAGVHKVVEYLARYSHRVAITNHRLKHIDRQNVQFHYKDYKQNAQKRVMTLDGKNFLKRFCLHILPPRFRKIRQYGFLANTHKEVKITEARRALHAKQVKLLCRAERKELAKNQLFGQKADLCPCCKKGRMGIVDFFETDLNSVLKRNKAPPDSSHLLIKV